MLIQLRHVCILLLFCCSAFVSAQETTADAGDPVTTGDPTLPVAELKLRLKPLTLTEVKVEVAGWLALLQAKAREISTADIAVSYRKAELAKADELEAALLAVADATQAVSQQPADAAAAARLEQAEAAVEEIKREAREIIRRAREDKEAVAITKIAVETIRQQEEVAATEIAVAAGEEQVVEITLDDVDAITSDGKTSEIRDKVQAVTDERSETRKDLLLYLTGLREQQIALIDRANTAIDDFERKGGKAEEVEEYRKYVSAIADIEVDVSDVSATWTMATGWLVSAEGGVRWLKNISKFVLIVLVAMLLARLVSRALKRVVARSKTTSRLLADFLVVTVYRLIIAIGILVGLAALEINIGPLLAVIGAAGFVIAFALQDSLGNFASGILIMMFKPFDVGDVVEIDGVLGKVQSMNLLSVLIYTPDNKSVIIPNNNVWGSSITNVTGTDTRRVDLVFGIAYDDDIEKAQKIMEQVVTGNDKVLKEPEPVIRVHELGDSSVNFICRPWVETGNYWEVYWDVTRSVKERFDQEGISIPFPQRDVHVYSTAINQGGTLPGNAFAASAMAGHMPGGDALSKYPAEAGSESPDSPS